MKFTEQQIKELKEARTKFLRSGIVLSVCVVKLAQVQIDSIADNLINWMNDKKEKTND